MIVSLWNLTGTSAALLPRCLSNFRAIEKVQSRISRLRDFTRSCGKTSHRLVNRGPAVYCLLEHFEGHINPISWWQLGHDYQYYVSISKFMEAIWTNGFFIKWFRLFSVIFTSPMAEWIVALHRDYSSEFCRIWAQSVHTKQKRAQQVKNFVGCTFVEYGPAIYMHQSDTPSFINYHISIM